MLLSDQIYGHARTWNKLSVHARLWSPMHLVHEILFMTHSFSPSIQNAMFLCKNYHIYCITLVHDSKISCIKIFIPIESEAKLAL